MATAGVFPKATGDTIYLADYNAIQTIVANVLGTGSGPATLSSQAGYGQTVSSSQIAAGTAITASQMQNLKTDLDKISYHQTFSASTAPSISAGGTISYSEWNTYKTQADTLNTNRFALSANQATATEGVAPTFANWNGLRTHTVTVTFADAANARYFFNAGGEIRIVPSHSTIGASGDYLIKGNFWSSLFTTVGTVKFGYTNTTANVTGSSIGWYSLTSSPQQVFLYTSAATYIGNIFSIDASCNVANNSTGTASVLTLSIKYNDAGYASSGLNNFDEYVGGTTTSLIQHYRATGSNVQVNAPTIATTGAP